MSDFTIYTTDTAPEKSKDLLESAQRKFGFVPNLIGLMAGAPATLKAYLALGEALAETSFTAVEQQVIALTVSRLNECAYCMGAHSGIAKMVGMSDADLEALRNGGRLEDTRLGALRQFTEAVVTKRGLATDEDRAYFILAGYTQSQILEVLVGVSMKTLSNYVNHIADTPLDEQFADFAWSPPVALAQTG